MKAAAIMNRDVDGVGADATVSEHPMHRPTAGVDRVKYFAKPAAAESARRMWNDGVSLWRVACLAIVAPWDDALRAFSERAGLLPKRMAAIGLDPSTFSRAEPLAFFDLERRCAACDSYGQCEWDLRQDPTDPVWQEYCPNCATLIGLAHKPPCDEMDRELGVGNESRATEPLPLFHSAVVG
jgi:hypothetical protein